MPRILDLDVDATADDLRGGQRGQAALEPRGRRATIRIDEGEKTPSRSLDAGIARRAGPLDGRRRHTGKVAAHAPNGVETATRVVVRDNDLELAERPRLRLQRAEAAREVRQIIVVRDDDRDERPRPLGRCGAFHPSSERSFVVMAFKDLAPLLDGNGYRQIAGLVAAQAA
jgi:hypothetical protein